MHRTTTSTTPIKPAVQSTNPMWRIQDQIAIAIKQECGASVEITIATNLCVSGSDEAVLTARDAIARLGKLGVPLVFIETATDDELPGERFDYYSF